MEATRFLKHLKFLTFSLVVIFCGTNLSAQNETPAASYSGNRWQNLVIGLHFNPVISWFSSDTKETSGEGARAGYDFGITFNKYFTSNYAFTLGLSLINAGGKLSSTDTTVMQFNNFKTTVLPGKTIVYRVDYLSLPFGLHLQTNQIGYFTWFSELGFDPKVILSGKADIPSAGITSENAIKELRAFNAGYHISGGVQYSLGGNTAFIAGLKFENNFLDLTKETGKQPADIVRHRLLSFVFGLNF